MKDDDEFEKLLGEIPHATPPLSLQNPYVNHSHNNLASQRLNSFTYRDHNFYDDDYDDDESFKSTYAFASSPVTASGFPLTSDDSSSSSFSGGRSHSNSSSSPPLFEPHYFNSKTANHGYFAIDRSELSRSFGKLNIHQCDGDFGRYDSFSYDVSLRKKPNSFGSQYPTLPTLLYTPAPGPQFYRANNTYPMRFLDNPPVTNPILLYPSPNLTGPSCSSYSSPNVSQLMQHYNDMNSIHHGRNKVVVRDREDSSMRTARNPRSFRGHNGKIQDKSWKIHCPLNHRPWKFSSLAETRGYVYQMAKDQQGCRFLQRMFVEGTPRDVHVIFSEIIDHLIELMMNSFGNYLVQKLLEVCTQEQRMQILFSVTDEPGKLVRISLNTFGTRAVQKLVETLTSKEQRSIVISALEPGFLTLMKDLNGSHLIKRCLQCFPEEDKEFIFVTAAKYCVDIATHQNGCCALQSCIKFSKEEHRKIFFAEITSNGLLLAEDAYGNYVVQYIFELDVPYATKNLIPQFEGNYVNLSTQKFSSHVVERCLLVCNEETRAKIIYELLSAPYFEQLLQDPYANYVIQTALRVSEGRIHYTLVDAIESYKAVSRNSPYSKKIFSQKLSKK